MFDTMTANPVAAYARVGLETGVMAANPHKLVLMLFDGALLSIASAADHMQAQRIADKGQAIIRAIDIINNGLKASLDYEVGGELAGRLGALYDYICMRLLHANTHNSQPALAEAANLLSEIRDAWREIADDPAALSKNRACA